MKNVKKHKFFKHLCALLAAIPIIVQTVIPCCAADSEQELSVWHSDKNKAGYWESSPMVYRKPLSASFSVPLAAYISAANAEWKGIRSFTYASSEGAADIICYGGTLKEMEAAKVPEKFDSSTTGRTVHSDWDSYQCKRPYGTEKKSIYKMSHAIIYILEDGRTENQTKKTTIHEFGHALGWFGHSSSDKDVMWQGGTSVTKITDRDHDHLSQIY